MRAQSSIRGVHSDAQRSVSAAAEGRRLDAVVRRPLESLFSRSSAHRADHRFDELLEGLVRQSRNLSDHQVRAGRKQLARPA